MSAVEPPSEQVAEGEEHFKPTGTIFLLVCFVAVLVLMWASVYVILISRGVTV
ncbi:MAG: cytochrome c oxidase subunit 2A [Acidimicrobiales bacterium]